MAVKKETAEPKARKDEKQLQIRLKKSIIGYPRKQRAVVKGLGLGKVDSKVIRKDCPEIWGMIRKVPHLVDVEELNKK